VTQHDPHQYHAPWPESVWASSARPAPALAALAGDTRTDVAIIGAGFTGLAAAHHLARAGVSCVVLEAHDAGWGASGRNGGMAVLRYKKPWVTLARQYGEAGARRLHRLLLEALDTLEATVAEHAIDCGFARSGHVTAAHSRSAVAMLEADRLWLASIGDHAPRLLDAAQTAAVTGTACYLGGYLDPRAGGISPLDYSRGLAAALAAKGVPIHVGSPVTALREEADRVTLETPGGAVHADEVLVCTNAYTELFSFARALERRVVPVSTSVVTTAPLPADLAPRILAQGNLVSDTRHLLNYFRHAPGGRLLYGGRGSLTGKEAPGVYAGLERRLYETFPQLAGIPVDHRWSGKVAVTLDDFPHVGRLSARTSYAVGYGGRGVVLTALLGRLAADLARGGTIDAGPMSANAFGPIPFHRLRVPAMQAVAGYYRLKDALGI
jgi:gamma-glutamylputrescine oxidase